MFKAYAERDIFLYCWLVATFIFATWTSMLCFSASAIESLRVSCSGAVCAERVGPSMIDARSNAQSLATNKAPERKKIREAAFLGTPYPVKSESKSSKQVG